MTKEFEEIRSWKAGDKPLEAMKTRESLFHASFDKDAHQEKLENEDKAIVDLSAKLAKEIYTKLAEKPKTGATWRSAVSDLVDGNLNPDYHLKAWAEVEVDAVSDAERAGAGGKTPDPPADKLEAQLLRVLKIDQLKLPPLDDGSADSSWPLQIKLQNDSAEVKLSMIVHLQRQLQSK